jgi:hypothetical protein
VLVLRSRSYALRGSANAQRRSIWCTVRAQNGKIVDVDKLPNIGVDQVEVVLNIRDMKLSRVDGSSALCTRCNWATTVDAPYWYALTGHDRSTRVVATSHRTEGRHSITRPYVDRRHLRCEIDSLKLPRNFKEHCRKPQSASITFEKKRIVFHGFLKNGRGAVDRLARDTPTYPGFALLWWRLEHSRRLSTSTIGHFQCWT